MNRAEITLQDILWSLKKYMAWIILTTAVFAVGAWVYTEFFVTPIYSTSFKMGVNSNHRDSSAQVTNNDLTTDARIADTYVLLLASQPVATAVSEHLDGAVSASQVASMIRASVRSDTMVIQVVIQSSNPQLAADVGNALSEVAPKVLGELPVGGLLYSIETAKVPTVPVSPNLTTNVTVGLMLGLLLSCAVVILIALMDTTIWREEDLARAFNIPVLGSIPSMNANSMAKLIKNRRSDS